MFPIVVKISQELIDVMEEERRRGPIETKDASARYTTDIIEFRVQGKRLFALTKTELLSNLMSFLFPNFMRFCNVRFFPKVATDFFWKIIKDTTEYREKNSVVRNDAIQLLLDMKNGTSKDNILTFDELAAQAFVFFVAGFDTSSSLISFALLELAMNEDVQNELRNEINTVLRRYNGEYTYEMLGDLPYADMVISETLRKYPPIPSLTRVCTKDYRIPGTDVIIPKGLRVFIPIQGIHNDPEIYPNPQKFDPTRFSHENKNKRHQFSFIPFGEGPRICLGLRFAMIQTKICLAMMIKTFKLTLNSKTTLPLKFDPMKFFPCPLGGLWIDLEKIE
ncbi:Cyp6a9 [Trypoxylus dichotomus]